MSKHRTNISNVLKNKRHRLDKDWMQPSLEKLKHSEKASVYPEKEETRRSIVHLYLTMLAERQAKEKEEMEISVDKMWNEALLGPDKYEEHLNPRLIRSLGPSDGIQFSRNKTQYVVNFSRIANEILTDLELGIYS